MVARAKVAAATHERVLASAAARHADVAHGEFGADMKVHLINDGPVTIPLTLRA